MNNISSVATGKWPSILTALGVDQSFLKNKHGPCPACGGKDRFRFDNKTGRGDFFCSQCGSGDGFTLLQKINGWTFKQTASEIEKIIGSCKSTPIDQCSFLPSATREERLKKIRSGLRPISQGDTTSLYLRSRGISMLPKKDVYTHPGLDYWHNNESGKPYKLGTYPAMVAAFRNIAGEMCTYHITYLTQDAQKITGYPAKKLMPPMRPMPGGSIQFGGSGEKIAISEGIETGLAAQQELGYPTWAAANSALMEKVEIPGYVKSVVIIADEDNNFAGQKSAYVMANRLSSLFKKEVNVVRLHGKAGPVWFDQGSGVDFLDYCQTSELD